MKRFYSTALLAVVALTLTVYAAPASAQLTTESGAKFAGHYVLDVSSPGLALKAAPTSATAAGDVYSNITSPATGGFSVADMAAIFGDRVTTTGGGLLDQNDFTVYNSGTSGGTLLTASFYINLYDGGTLAPIGGYLTGTVTFTGGLPPGYYSIVTVNGLAGLGINLATTDVLITQQIANFTGTPTRAGIVLMDPPSIGSSPAYMYINSVAVGPAGFYNLGINANPGYRINVTNATPTRTSTWGQLKTLYR